MNDMPSYIEHTDSFHIYHYIINLAFNLTAIEELYHRYGLGAYTGVKLKLISSPHPWNGGGVGEGVI